MSSASQTPRELFRALRKDTKEYWELARGAESSALCYYRHILDSEVSPFFRPDIGLAILSREHVISPDLLFNRRKEDFSVQRLDPDHPDAAEGIDAIQQAYEQNRLRLIVFLASIEPRTSRRGLLGALFPWVSSRRTQIIATRSALLAAHRAKIALEQKSEAIRMAISDGRLALVEGIFDPLSSEIQLDVGGVFQE